MKKGFIVKPTELKGVDKVNRIKELMGHIPLNEDKRNSVVELTKLGPDGLVYGIVREGHEYYIKTTNKTKELVVEDFNYIGGLQNKKSEAYPSYAKALKKLNLKFISLNEAYGKSEKINVFTDDNLLVEHHPYKSDQKLSATKGMGDSTEYIVNKKGKELSYDAKEGKESSQFGDNVAEKDVEDEFEEVTMSENELAVDNILEADKIKQSFIDQYGSDEGEKIYYATANKQGRDAETFEKVDESHKGRFSITKALDIMESILGEDDGGDLRSVKVFFDNGDHLTTSMAKGLTDDDIKDYYKVGKSFNLGDGFGGDKMAKVSKIEILKENASKLEIPKDCKFSVGKRDDDKYYWTLVKSSGKMTKSTKGFDSKSEAEDNFKGSTIYKELKKKV